MIEVGLNLLPACALSYDSYSNHGAKLRHFRSNNNSCPEWRTCSVLNVEFRPPLSGLKLLLSIAFINRGGIPYPWLFANAIAIAIADFFQSFQLSVAAEYPLRVKKRNKYIYIYLNFDLGLWYEISPFENWKNWKKLPIWEIDRL